MTAAPPDLQPLANCLCHQCRRDRADRDQSGWLTHLQEFIVCSWCGNKRCPHATDHRHMCTQSNDAGQPGSLYGNYQLRGVEPVPYVPPPQDDPLPALGLHQSLEYCLAQAEVRYAHQPAVLEALQHLRHDFQRAGLTFSPPVKNTP